MTPKLRVVEGRFAICRLSPEEAWPDWLQKASFYSVLRSSEELSILCAEHLIPETCPRESGWCLMQVEGPLAFELVGVLASILKPLAEAKISILAVSSFDTDYILVKAESLGRAQEALKEAGIGLVA